MSQYHLSEKLAHYPPNMIYLVAWCSSTLKDSAQALLGPPISLNLNRKE